MPFPLSTLGPTIDATGISAPPYADILSSLQASAALIYGSDVYLGVDTQDGQMLAIYAKGISDCNDAIIATYNAFRPASAQGAGLSSLVKLNGIARNIPSNSQVDVLLGGSPGTAIINGVVADVNGQLWDLPTPITIPPAASLIVTATAVNPGALAANPGTVSTINTPTFGWQTVTNPAAASLGAPVESDAALRVRQGQSVALPALTVLAATTAAIEALVGVTEVKPYENDTGTVDVNGLPAHSISMVVQGGDATQIATAIMVKKTPGCSTYGNITVPVVDSVGFTHNISFFVPINVPISVQLNITAFQGYTAATGDAIKAAIVDYINNTLTIGADVEYAAIYLPAQLFGGAGSEQYKITFLGIARIPNSPSNVDIVIAFNEQATCQASDITLNVS